MQIAEYILVKNAAGEPRAYLSPETDGIKDAYIDRRLNAESVLEFYIPPSNPKAQELTPECRIIVDGREFTILRSDAVDIERSEDGKLWLKVMAVESWGLLDKELVTVSNDPQTPTPADLQVVILSGGPAAGGYSQGSAGSALTYLLQGQSTWTLGTVDVPGIHDLETEKMSLLQNIKKVQELWGGYLVWEYVFDATGRNVTARKLHLRSEATWQNYTGFGVRYAKNQKSITRTDNNDIVTVLYPFGQDDLDISSVNGGKKYLENYSYTATKYFGTYTNQEISDPQELKTKAEEVLTKICQPRYTYRVGLVDLRTLPEYEHEDFALGDLVDVYDPDVANARARIQRYKYNVFQPWNCELEIGEPKERLAAQLKNSFDAANFVKEALKPNPSISNLLKAFVNTFTTEINGASGNYTCVDGVSTWWDVDSETGERTGKIVRITPGGMGISSDGGQSFKTAITGDGILANTIICTALYALASGDGFTKLTDDGLHVYDDTAQERVHVGRWLESLTYHYGIKILASDGSTVLLDDGGSLQTWQVPKEDNVDDVYGVTLGVHLPSEVRSIKKAILRFRLKAFRAYEKAALSKNLGTLDISTNTTGQSSTTSSSVSNHDHVYGQTIVTITDYGFNARTTDPGGGDNHIHSYQDKSATEAWLDIDTTWGGGAHSHDITHTHGIDHSHNVGSHSHGLDYGIYTSTTPQNVTIKINGVDRTAALGGPFNSDQSNINIAPYLIAGQYNDIELGSTRLGRIEAHIFVQVLMGV